jgi:hypothetical protein
MIPREIHFLLFASTMSAGVASAAPPKSPPIQNPGFESPTLAGWTDDKGKPLSLTMRECGAVDAGELRDSGDLAMKNSPRVLGGDYWNVPMRSVADRGAC